MKISKKQKTETIRSSKLIGSKLFCNKFDNKKFDTKKNKIARFFGVERLIFELLRKYMNGSKIRSSTAKNDCLQSNVLFSNY